MARKTYEPASEYDGAVTVAGHPGMAWRVLGWETETVVREEWEPCAVCGGDGEILTGDDDDTESCAYCDGTGQVDATGYEPEPERTGFLVCVMVGDDRHWTFDPSEVTPIDRDAYCGVCGQMGCGHDGLERD
jgi:hypothetical protein